MIKYSSSLDLTSPIAGACLGGVHEGTRDVAPDSFLCDLKLSPRRTICADL